MIAHTFIKHTNILRHSNTANFRRALESTRLIRTVPATRANATSISPTTRTQTRNPTLATRRLKSTTSKQPISTPRRHYYFSALASTTIKHIQSGVFSTVCHSTLLPSLATTAEDVRGRRGHCLSGFSTRPRDFLLHDHSAGAYRETSGLSSLSSPRNSRRVGSPTAT